MIKKLNKNGNSTYIFNECNAIVIFLLLAFINSVFQAIFPFHLESSLIAQSVKNLPAMQETVVSFYKSWFSRNFHISLYYQSHLHQVVTILFYCCSHERMVWSPLFSLLILGTCVLYLFQINISRGLATVLFLKNWH